MRVVLILLCHLGVSHFFLAGKANASEIDLLREKLQRIQKSHAGKSAIAVENLETKEKILINGDVVMPTASLIKVTAMIEAYRQLDSEHLDFDKQLTLQKSDKVPGSGILTSHFGEGMSLSVRDSIQLMMAVSDNTATNKLLDEITLESISKTMKKMGYRETLFNSKVYRGSTSSINKKRSELYGLGSTTATEMLDIFKKIRLGEMVSKKASDSMMKHLYSCDDKTKISRRFPAGTRFAHKTGAISHARCDAGVLETRSGPVAIVVLTSENKDRSWTKENQAEQFCGKIGKTIFDHFHSVTTEKPAATELRVGAFGILVEHLQRTLNSKLKPSPNLSIDGDFGPATRSAVIRFQESKSIPANGVVNKTVWNALGPLKTSDDPILNTDEINQAKLKKEPADKLTGIPFLTAKAWAIGDAHSGKILYGDNQNQKLDIASTTKMMTAYLVVRLAENDPGILDEQVQFSRRADQTRGSTSGIREGERLTVGELLYGLMLPSGNDASVALAEHFGGRGYGESKSSDQKDGDLGSEDSKSGNNASTANQLIDVQKKNYEAFLNAMNSTAKKLGMNQTLFKNPHGLTAAGHRSSASDLVKLATAALKLKLFREIVKTRQHATTLDSVSGYKRNVVWKNTNRLLGIEGYFGVKTGTTTAAGACLVSAGERKNQKLIVVVLGSGSSKGRYADTRNLYRWAWNKLEANQKKNSKPDASDKAR